MVQVRRECHKVLSFYVIGNFDFLNRKKKRMFIKHTLDKEKRAHLSNDFRGD